MGVKTGVGWQLVAGRTVTDHAEKKTSRKEARELTGEKREKEEEKRENEGVLGCSSAGPEI